MADDTSWMDALPDAQPTSGMIAAGLAKAQKAQPDAIPSMTIRPKAPDASWMDALPDAQPTSGMLLALGKQPGSAPQGQGLAANFAAGANKQIFGALGAPVDLATGALNLIPRGINAVAGTQIPRIQNPVGGSEWLGQQFGRISVDPNTVQPTTEGESIAQGAGAGMASVPTLALGGAAAAARGMSGVPGSVANAIRSSGGATVPSAALTVGAATAGGGAGQAASDAVPEWAKPYADIAGNLAGAGVVAAGAASPLAAKVIARKAGEAGVGFKKDVGAQRATTSQALAAGDKLASSIGPEGQQTIERTLDTEKEAQGLEKQLTDPTLTPAERAAAQQRLGDIQGRRVNIVPNANPTTAQIAQAPGATDLENALRVQNGPAFSERAQQQNNARVAAIQDLEPNQGEPASVGEFFTDYLRQLDERGQQAIGAQTGQVQGQTEALGGEAPRANYGAQIRETLQAAEAPEHAAASRAFAAVDPEGAWAIPSAPLRDVAAGLAKDVSPTAQTDGQTDALLSRGQSLPGVIKFSDLSQMRADANDALKRLMRTGTAPSEVRRLTLFKNGIDQTILDSVNKRSAVDPGVEQRLQGELGGRSPAQAASGNGGLGSPGPRAGGAYPPSQPLGANGAGAQRPGGINGAGNVAPAPANARAPGRPESFVDYLISHGGIQDPTGDLKAMDADLLHHQKGGRLVNPRGMTPDHARELGQQEGFLQADNGLGPNQVGINDVYQAIQEHLSGRPTYRAGDVAQAEAYRQGQQAAQQNAAYAERLYDARDAVNAYADQAQMPLMANEREDAAHLVLQGFHPEEAIHQAALASQDRALELNARRGAFSGRLGMPQAQQTEMPIGGGTRLVPNVGEAEAGKYYGAVQRWRDLKQKFGQGGVGAVLEKNDQGFKVSEGNVPSKIFTGGPTEPAEVERFITAVGGPDKADEIGRNVLANDLRAKGIVRPDGTVDADKLSGFLRTRAATLAQFPGLQKQFANIEAAQRTLNDVTAAHKAAVDEFNRSAAAQFIHADPAVAVRRALASANPTETFTQLAQAVRGNAEAEAGLKRAVVDYIVAQHSSAVPSADGIDMLKAAGFRSWVAKYKGPLRALFGGQGLQNLEMVAADLRRQAQGPVAAAGSQTAPHAARAKRLAVGAVTHVAPLTVLTLLGEQLGEHLGQHGMIGAAIGMAAHTLQQARIRTINDLVREAMLHPELARTLMEKANASKALSAMTQRRIATALQGAIMADLATGEHRQ